MLLLHSHLCTGLTRHLATALPGPGDPHPAPPMVAPHRMVMVSPPWVVVVVELCDEDAVFFCVLENVVVSNVVRESHRQSRLKTMLTTHIR